LRSVLVFLVIAFPAPAAWAQFNLDLNQIVNTVKNAAKAVQEIGEPEEIAIGNDMAARLLGAAPLLPDPKLQQYVNHIGRWLAAQTERPNLPWQFGVLDAPELNAFAVPGGTIFVTKGLLANVSSEAELAGVLAHEIVHVLKKHHLKAIQKNAQTALAGDALSAALKDSNSPGREKLVSFGNEMYTRGLDKSDELEADRLGVVIAARGGYDAYGLPAVLQTLQAMNAQDSALALMFKTHPAPAERLDALSEKMQPTLDRYAGQPQLSDRFGRETKAAK
jgi:predicted Zn-dependent protease